VVRRCGGWEDGKKITWVGGRGDLLLRDLVVKIVY